MYARARNRSIFEFKDYSCATESNASRYSLDLGIPEDELRKEADTPEPKKSLRRLFMTIINPKRAMIYIIHDPDLAIILIISMILTLYFILVAIVYVTKLDLPDNMAIKLMPKVGRNQTKFMSIGEYKVELIKLYVSSNVVLFILSTVTSSLILYVISKIFIRLNLGKKGNTKAIFSGVFYTGAVIVITGILWLMFIFMTQPVKVETCTIGNVTYIKLSNGTLVEATEESLSSYFETKLAYSFVGYNSPLIMYLRLLSKFWQALILFFLVKYNYSLNNIKSSFLIIAQQSLMLLIWGA
ncbi:MAG: hypothetical protein QXH91_01555 [Candidatus Bathyarchaeia archaeon]